VEVAHETGLSVRLDGYELRSSPSGRMESLKTRVTLLDESGEILTGDIEINGPLIYKGIAFYHMDQGETPGGLVLLAAVDGAVEELTVDFGSSFTLKGGAEYTLGDIYPDFALDADGAPYSRSPEFVNPYVEVISRGGMGGMGDDREFLPVAYPGRSVTFGHGPSATTIRLADYKLTPYVILTINKDPGILLIIAGSLVLVTGMALLLLFRGERAELVRKADGASHPEA
jgi:cytochrome c biogenesis protein ResB